MYEKHYNYYTCRFITMSVFKHEFNAIFEIVHSLMKGRQLPAGSIFAQIYVNFE